MRVEETLAAYVCQLEADGRSEHTIGQAKRHVALLASWLAASGHRGDVDEIRHEDVARFLASDVVRHRADGKARKPTSANSLRSTIRTFFRYVHGAGYARSNAAALVRRARCGDAPPKALSERDQERLLHALAGATSAAEKRDRVLFTLLLRCGPRIGAVLAVCIEDLVLDLGEVLLRREKARRQRRLFLPDDVVALLRVHVGRRRSGPLFVGAGDRPLNGRHVARRLALWCRRAGIRRVSPHALRHTFACRIYEKTGDLLTTRDALGHASIASTTVYAALPTERLRAVVTG